MLDVGKVIGESDWNEKLGKIPEQADREMFRRQWSEPRKYYDGPKKKQG